MSTKLLRRALILGSVSCAALSTQALAVTVSTPRFTFSNTPLTCDVNFVADVDGVLDDGGGNDTFTAQLVDATGRVLVFNNNSVPVGTTRTYSRNLGLLRSASGTGPISLQVVNTSASGDTIAFQSVIDMNQLAATGGNCATVAANFAASPNQAPTANAGQDQNITGNVTVTLDGSASSDPDNDPLTYSWTQTGGPVTTINNANSAQASFTPALQLGATATYTFELTATDPSGLASTDTVTINVSNALIIANQPPVADAGSFVSAQAGATVTLNGTGSSDPDGTIVDYSWNQAGGPAVTLNNPNTDRPSFTVPSLPAGVTLRFELVVTDDDGAQASDFVEVQARPANQAPTADAGADQTVNGLSSVTLDASASSDPDGNPLTFNWVQVSGPTVTLSNANTANPTFTAPAAGGGQASQTIEFRVDVSDGTATSADFVRILIAGTASPDADAGPDQTVTSGVVTLDGSASNDVDGTITSYEWRQVSGPNVPITNANSAVAFFAAPPATGSLQTLVFELLVTDNNGAQSTDRVTVSVAANRPPVADAGADQGPIDAGQTVTLDGTGSTDPDNDTLTYSWVQTGGATVTLNGANTAQPTFTAPQANDTLTFELTVSDGTVSTTDTVSVETRATGTITIVQQITGSDTQVSFTSNLAALQTSVTTSGGTAQVSAQSVPTGTYTVTAADLSAQGIAVTDISCSDSDSTGNVGSRTATIELGAGEDVTCTFTAANSREAAQAAIYSFLTGRNALILANQPDLQRRIDRLTPGGGSLSAYGINVPFSDKLPIEATIGQDQSRFRSDLSMALGGKSERVFDVWGEAVFSSATIGTQDASFSIISVGADIKLGEDVLIGALAQFDDLSDSGTLEAGEAEGDGYLIGPYLTARLADGFFVEARAAWGGSDNVVSPFAGQRDAFETDRSLYSGSLIGQVALGDKTTLRPELTVRYLSEDQQAYTDSLGIAIPAQTVDQGNISFRPRISHVIDSKGFSLRPYAQIEGIYTFGTEPDAALANLLPGNFADTFGDVRARIEGGVDLLGEGSFRATLSGFADGIGADGFSNEGVRLGVSFGF